VHRTSYLSSKSNALIFGNEKSYKGVFEMKCSMRMKLVVVGALLAVLLLAGSVWADEDAVTQAINNYNNTNGTNLATSGTGTGFTINGTADGVTKTLDLGDISGLTINWQATLTGEGEPQWDDVDNKTHRRYLLRMKASEELAGTLNIIDGKIENTGPTANGQGGWYYAVSAYTNVDVNVSEGGYIGVTVANGAALQNFSDKNTDGRGTPGTITVTGGTILAPTGTAIAAGNLVLENTSGITGVVIAVDFVDSSGLCSVYGETKTSRDSEVFFDKYDPSEDDGLLPDSMSYVAKNGAKWTIEGVSCDMTDLSSEGINVTMKTEGNGTINFQNTDLTFEGTFNVSQNGVLNVGVAPGDRSHLTHRVGTATNDGTINIYGTLTNLDRVINNGIINNYSGKTLDNRGTLENNKEINNRASGKITSTGTIKNAPNAVINNTEGGIFGSDQTKESMGGTVNGPVLPINDTSSGGGGGCNAGLGMVGLLLAGLVVLKRRAYVK
jgi:hypothetical protein